MFAQLLAVKDYFMSAPAREEKDTIYGGTAAHENVRSPLFSEELFTKLLALERKRAERSRKAFALMLVDASKQFRTEQNNVVFGGLLTALSSATRETDIWGWHKAGAVIGVILTELGSADPTVLRNTMLSKLRTALLTTLKPVQLEGIQISFHVFPEPPGSRNGDGLRNEISLDLYPDLQSANDKKKVARLLKRVIDFCGSVVAMIVLSPVFLTIAAAIKLTSKGPILFKQERVGQYGKPFTFLKFRSMYFMNDPKIHEAYVKRLIAGKNDCKLTDESGGPYKLQNDPRITPLGKLLRRTSLDELPQFFNVLRGDMSLVGPRPPIPYETEVYDIWHRRRFFEAKPGITGLWQVKGRSRVKFDDMVRMDIQYMRDWSLGLDLKILLETPRVLFFDKGAR